jgi:hypothetical protein
MGDGGGVLAEGDRRAVPDVYEQYVPAKEASRPQRSSLTAATVYSGTLDIVLAILPWKIVWNLTINRREKLGAMVAMSMGVLYVLPSHPAPCLHRLSCQLPWFDIVLASSPS